MQKEAEEQLIAFHSTYLLTVGEGRIAMAVPFHLSLSVVALDAVPTAIQRLCVEQLTPESSDDEPGWGR